ncbi:hypothetical protein E4T66_16670 [Sinimarinibacterium sp. CAU 1509]|uniref:hypothetical protein n=1 Tax=Sinimarinibacterium sp. CAU 1509 TaxID=2562283 RepID=UPI0010ABDFEA|nr:hypothetical protein [Sinimarinibacterium sp. CAU 1509]TJY58324.1 hypothetical protein E4T66_16670 [Sinimarinibacterium sp. CAU 1509]
MDSRVAEFQQMLRAALDEAKAAGLVNAASQLEFRAFAAYTTSSELLGETGVAIKEFLQTAGPAIPPLVVVKLNLCLTEVRKVWPRI